MNIKIATLNDIEEICQLYDEFFAYNAGLQPSSYKAGKEKGEYPKSTIENNESEIFMAIENGVAVGFIHIREAKTPAFDAFVPHHYAEIIDFMTTAAYREKGIGTMLMDAAKQWAKARNLEYIELLVLSNAKAEICFYEHKSFVPVSHTMRCSLSNVP